LENLLYLAKRLFLTIVSQDEKYKPWDEIEIIHKNKAKFTQTFYKNKPKTSLKALYMMVRGIAV